MLATRRAPRPGEGQEWAALMEARRLYENGRDVTAYLDVSGQEVLRYLAAEPELVSTFDRGY